MCSLEERNARLDGMKFPYHRQATGSLFNRYDRRFREGLELIVRGAGAAVKGHLRAVAGGGEAVTD